MTLWKRNGGTTMVEVIVAFTVLILIMGIFSQAMGMAGRMLNRSEDTLVNNRNLAGQYYLGKAALESRKNITFKFVEESGSGSSFTLDGALAVYRGTAEDETKAEGKIYAAEEREEPASGGE